jgi:hypothetical protein
MQSKMRIRVFKKLIFLTAFLGIIFGYQNCAKTKFVPSDSLNSSTDVQSGQGDDTNIHGGKTPGDDTTLTGKDPGRDPNVPCPPALTNILIIDLKSGWWEGDGAGTFGRLAKQINTQCSQIDLEYGHITNNTGNVGSFPSKSFNDYDEIWVLSGAVDDNFDLRIDSVTFQRFLDGIKNSKANLFLGTGNGAIYHTNAITTALGFGDLVLAGGSSFLVVTAPTGNIITVESQITKSQMRANHPLFMNVAVLPDSITVNGDTLVSDKLVSDASLDSLVTNSKGISEIGQLSLGSRQIVLDADLGRMYNVLNGDANVRNYIVNLMTTLGK